MHRPLTSRIHPYEPFDSLDYLDLKDSQEYLGDENMMDAPEVFPDGKIGGSVEANLDSLEESKMDTCSWSFRNLSSLLSWLLLVGMFEELDEHDF